MAFKSNLVDSFKENQQRMSFVPPPWIDGLMPHTELREEKFNFSFFPFDHHRDSTGDSPPWIDSLPPLPGMSDEIKDSNSFHLDQHIPPFAGPPPWINGLMPHAEFFY